MSARTHAHPTSGPVLTSARVTKAPPCGDCPWRTDSVGRVTPHEVRQLRPCADPEGPPQGCHTTRTRMCAGYLHRVGRNRADIAIPAAMHGIDIFRDLPATVPLFSDYPAMFAAHEVPPCP